MDTKYPTEELTPLSEAVKMLIRGGVDVSHSYMRTQIQKGTLKGERVGLHYFVLTTEIDRLKEEFNE